MLSARAAKCGVSGLGRRKGALRSISFAMTRSRRATVATALERVFTNSGNAPNVGLVAWWSTVPARLRAPSVRFQRNPGSLLPRWASTYIDCADENYTREIRRHAHADRPAFTRWPAAFVRPSPTSHASELRPTDGVPPVWAGCRWDDPCFSLRQFSTLRDRGECRTRARWSRFRFRQRISSRSLRPPDVRPARPPAAAPSAAPSLASPRSSVP